MIHDLDLILYGVAYPLIDLRASGCSHGLTPIDEAQVEMIFANGCRAHLRAYWGCGAGQEDRYMIAELGDNETWMMDFNRRASFRTAFRSPIHNLSNDESPALASAARNCLDSQRDTLSLQLASFLDASRHRAVPRVTPEDGHAALRLAQRIRQRILQSA